jgi:hypothetical protein
MFFFQSNVLDEEDWLVRRKEMFTKEPTRPFYIFYSFNVELHEGQASENRPNIRVRYTVKPVYNGQPWDGKIVAVVDRWSLFRGKVYL